MTVYKTEHIRQVRYVFSGATPGRPALPLASTGEAGPNVLSASPDVKEVWYFFDPLIAASAPPTPAPGGTIDEDRSSDFYVVTFIHDGSTPAAPSLTEALAFGPITLDLGVSGLKRTLYYFTPLEPEAGATFAYLNGDIFLFLNGDTFTFL